MKAVMLTFSLSIAVVSAVAETKVGIGKGMPSVTANN